MSNILCFSRNRSTNVEQVGEDIVKSRCRLQDTLNEAFVEITVQLPDLEIIDVSWEVSQTYQKRTADEDESLRKVIGVRIGPGMLKIIKGLVGRTDGNRELTFMIEECCHGVILAFTKDQLFDAPTEAVSDAETYKMMIKANPRLYNRCAAFAPGSPLVEGIEPPAGTSAS